jgi:hypothetical protein
MELERAAGRRPRDTRHAGAPADIESPPRLIEVKSFGTSNRGYDLLMEVRQVEEALRNPVYYVYVVENVGLSYQKRPSHGIPVPAKCRVFARC